MTNTDLMNVNAFENLVPDQSFANLNPADESLADGIGQSYGIVGYRGKVWTLRKNGETYTFTRPDDGSPSAFLDVVILRSAGYRSKSWYEGGYQEGVTGQRPTCASLNGVNPDSDVLKAQAQACAICPRNEFKVNAQGRKGKDCSDYKRLSVLLLPYQTKPIMGEALLEPVFLRVPAASLNDLAVLGEAMQRKGFHYSTYITRIGFDIEKPHPQMTFRALQPLTAKEAPLVIQLREDPQAYRITGESEIGKASNAVVAGAQSRVQQQTNGAYSGTHDNFAGADRSTVSAMGTGESEVDKLRRQLAEAEAKTKTLETAPPAIAGNGSRSAATLSPHGAGSGGSRLPQVDFGLGLGDNQPVVEVAPSGPGQAAAPATASLVPDTPVEESDADLDARVAGLLSR